MIQRYLSGILMGVICLLATPSKADIKLPSLVGSNMVLQQKQEVTLWGWADAGEKIKIKASWKRKRWSTTADADGNWKLKVKTPEAGGPYTLSLKGKNEIELTNVMVGEVWLCSGQSNMKMPVGRVEGNWRTGVAHYEEVVKTANYPDIRFFTVKEVISETLLNDVEGEWLECNPESIYDFSAVAYFFGRDLYNDLKVPIGLINNAWGGTPAEAWVNKSVLESDKRLSPILERYAKNCEEYPEKYKAYEAKRDSFEALGAETKQEAPKPPKNPKNNKAPNLIYNGMVYPMLNYTFKGAIWYQGESNAQRAYQYRTLFPALIHSWREDFDCGDFPFYFVQIAPHRGQNPEIREAQLLTMQSVEKTGMVVITDIGNPKNIHPIKKQPVGERLSLWARANTYGVNNLVYSGPIYKSMEVKENKAYITFDYVGTGLVCKGDSLTYFSICGEDKEFVPADAEIVDNQIVVSAEGINHPVAVRFGWENSPEHNFFNAEGLPASPFRTDDWPEPTFEKW